MEVSSIISFASVPCNSSSILSIAKAEKVMCIRPKSVTESAVAKWLELCTLERKVRGSIPTSAVLCPGSRHIYSPKY